MKRIAIVIPAENGHTTRIANQRASQLNRLDATVDLVNVASQDGLSASDLAQYDAVIVGCPVYLGDFPQLLMDWTWEHRDQLNMMPSAFFTVSLNAADPRPKARAIDDKVLRNYLVQTDFRPRFVASVGGALEYTRYGFFKRCVLQGVSAAAGGPTDTSRDFDLTNWADVAQFVSAFFEQDMTSDYATVNRLPVAPHPVWPIGLPRVA